MTDRQHLASLARKLGTIAQLDSLDAEAILSLPFSVENVDPGRHLVREGSRPSNCCLLVSGYACRYKVNAVGGRQIVSFHIAGDIIDLQHLHLGIADHHVQAITKATVAWIPMMEIKRMAKRRPAVAEALWRDTLIDASIFREWVLNVGRRDAKSRVAHMLCEFALRCDAAGLGSVETFEWPLTQAHIGDASGRRAVLVNRTLKLLSGLGALESAARRYQVKDWAQLRLVAEFDDTYLHIAAA